MSNDGLKSFKMKHIYAFLAFFVLAPVITIILFFLYLYRLLVNTILRIQLKDKYIGLLEGSDCIWAIEDPSARSIINILVILEKDARHSNVNFLEDFRNIVKNRMLVSPSFEKLLYKRGKKYGYYFWEKNEEIDLEQQVRWLENQHRTCDGFCENIYNSRLRTILQNISNEPLPASHTTSWEILVGKSCMKSSHHYIRRLEERGNIGKIRIPILFRVHHSLGDGTALMNFFLEAIVDKESTDKVLRPIDTNIKIANENFYDFTVMSPMNYTRTKLTCDQMIKYSIQNEVLSASMPFIHSMIYMNLLSLLQNHVESSLKYIKCLTVDDVKTEIKILLRKKWNVMKDFIVDEVYERVKSFLKIVMIAIIAPLCLAQQAIRSMDDSVLHGSKLSGEKVISYWLEDDFKDSYEQTLLTKIQSIKYITGARFVDVFLAAFSASLHKYFLRVNEDAPNSLSAVLPMKLEDSNPNSLLKNNFSVGILPICISQVNGETLLNPHENSKILDRLQDIQNAHDDLKKSPDYTVNLMVIKYLSAILPERILRPFLESHSTMVFSNLAGPQEVRILGHSVKNVVFWIPNRSNTGIGCSLFTYRGYVHLSLMADKALIHNEGFFNEILENTIREIDDLYNRLTVSSFSKSFDTVASTPTKGGIGVL